MSRKRLLDKLIVIDVEATCWEDGNHNRSDGQVSEIIEIGIALVDIKKSLSSKDDAIVENKSIVVKPCMSSVSEFCTKLTTLTQADVDRGVSLAEACAMLRQNYGLELRTWGSWGNYDKSQFERECKSKGIKYPFGYTHINLKNLFSILNGYDKEFGVGQALEQCGYKFKGTQHRGVDDAYNIARLFLV